ncbi:MAG: hypothetical protein HY901_28695, partial [Deltaproteobacteria bacterium]|nr:hypothetical protein [Deltaproteobacteria bacterium]
FVELRSLLNGFPARLATEDLVRAVGDFAEFTQGLTSINRRAMLVEHDREVLASCAVVLEGVDQQLRALKPADALACLAEAVTRVQDLYGRNTSLDAYLRKVRKRDLSTLSAAELEAETEVLRELLASATAE